MVSLKLLYTIILQDQILFLVHLPVGASVFAITSVQDANSNSIDAGNLPPAYTINIYNIADARINYKQYSFHLQ